MKKDFLLLQLNQEEKLKEIHEREENKARYYIPDFHDENGNILKNNDDLKEQYKSNMNALFNTYKLLLINDIPKEDARYILPYSFNSNIIMGIDANTLNRLVIRLLKKKESKCSELNELGEKL